MRLKVVATLVAASLSVGLTRADVITIINDSFAHETTTYNPLGYPWSTVNFNSFQNWNVSRGSVDLVNTGGVYPSQWFQHGVNFNPSFTFVDLDGTTGQSGQITSKNAFNLTPGTYRLSFDIAGAQGRDPRHHDDGMTVRLDGLGITEHYELAFDDPFETKTIEFTVDTPTRTSLSFANESDDPTSLNDNQGPLLGNIQLLNLTGDVANVPEPSTLFIAAGLVGSVCIARKLSRKRRVKVVKVV
jgi:hypothetical protein